MNIARMLSATKHVITAVRCPRGRGCAYNRSLMAIAVRQPALIMADKNR